MDTEVQKIINILTEESNTIRDIIRERIKELSIKLDFCDENFRCTGIATCPIDKYRCDGYFPDEIVLTTKNILVSGIANTEYTNMSSSCASVSIGRSFLTTGEKSMLNYSQSSYKTLKDKIALNDAVICRLAGFQSRPSKWS